MVNFTHVLPARLLLREDSEGTLLEQKSIPQSESAGKPWIKEPYDRIQLRNSVKKSKLTKPFKKYEDAFNAQEFDPGKNAKTHHAIPLKNFTPIQPTSLCNICLPYRPPIQQQNYLHFLLLYGKEANHPGDTMFPEQFNIFKNRPPQKYYHDS
jgi:hypothetical protein